MINYFPGPYLDESIYSIVARYHIHKGNTGDGVTLKEFFGNNKLKKVDEIFLRNLPSLIRNISVFSNHFTLQHFIDNHSEVPLVRPFKDNIWYDDLISNSAKSRKEGLIAIYPQYLPKHYSTKTKNISVKEHFYYCPKCLVEQYDEYGEYFWKRTYQVPGIMVCTYHKIPLIEHDINYRKFNKVGFIIPKLEDTYKSGDRYEEGIIEELLTLISQDLEYLIKRNLSSVSYDYLFNKYSVLMEIKGIGYPIRERENY